MFKHTLSIVASATLVASLGAQTLAIEPIAISAIKAEQTLKDTTSNVQIITSQELEEKHITSVIDALRMLGSVSIAQSGGLGQQSSFFQRGFSAVNTVVMIDGMRYNDPTTTQGQAQLEHLMINNIERIEIINGAQSGVWGANAAAGVINIITKKANEKLSIGGNLEYGSYATTKIAADASQKIGSLSYYIGVNQVKSNGFSALTPKGKNPEDYEADGYKNQTLNAKLGYDISPSDALKANFTLIDAKIQYDKFTANDAPNEIHQVNRLGNIGYRHSFNTLNYIDATYAVTAFDRKDPLGFTKTFEGTNKELNLLGNFHYMDNAFVVFGINTLDSKNTVNAKELDSKGVFFTNTNRLNALILTESLRHDKYDSFNDKTTGKLGAKYFFTEDVSLSSNYGTAYRTPSLFELYASTYGNASLQPETTKSFDATFEFQNLIFTYYNNLVDNLIGFDPFTYVNTQVIGKSRLQGYEIRYNNTFADVLTLNLSFNKLFAKDKDGNDLIRRPQESAMGSLFYYPTSKLSLGTTLNYIGTRLDKDYNTWPATTVQTGRYTLVSVVVNYNITDAITLYLRGDNLTNKLYQEVEGYGTAGRNAGAGLTARF